MALVWQYGEKSGFQTWKGLTWGMVSKRSGFGLYLLKELVKAAGRRYSRIIGRLVRCVPPLGGALCACTWHFFYNAESLEV
ncbi:hypothetical protein B296_00030452 [Ensete ventricosum]|uniref:Uncharacterized protein n=1 Tax=Ensete ventricosum TaxID=4639 RepID=A0A426XLG5_ENSVE|nr:hypothetical protein B296_00030452 [Ensete ventricosum]